MIFTLLGLLVILIVAGVFFAQRISQKNREEALLNRNIRHCTLLMNELWDVMQAVPNYIMAPDILEALIEQYKRLVHKRDSFKPNPETQKLLDEADEFLIKAKAIPSKDKLESDSEINLCKKTFAKASKVLRAAAGRKEISPQIALNMRNSMRMKLLHMEVDTYVSKGISAGQNNDPMTAATFYKYAKKLLIESDLKFEGKVERVREISDMTRALFGGITTTALDKGMHQEDEMSEQGFPTNMNAEKKKF
jgi:hypothetical protein